MQVGHVARIADGPLRGLTGIVIKIKSGMKLGLSVRLLQRSVAVEVDRRWVSPAQPVRSTAHQGAFDRSIPLSVDPSHPQASESLGGERPMRMHTLRVTGYGKCCA